MCENKRVTKLPEDPKEGQVRAAEIIPRLNEISGDTMLHAGLEVVADAVCKRVWGRKKKMEKEQDQSYSQKKRTQIKKHYKFLEKKKSLPSQKKVTIDAFEQISTISRGAFGFVFSSSSFFFSTAPLSRQEQKKPSKDQD